MNTSLKKWAAATLTTQAPLSKRHRIPDTNIRVVEFGHLYRVLRCADDVKTPDASSPGGRFDNSPAVYCQVFNRDCISPEGTAECTDVLCEFLFSLCFQ